MVGMLTDMASLCRVDYLHKALQRDQHVVLLSLMESSASQPRFNLLRRHLGGNEADSAEPRPQKVQLDQRPLPQQQGQNPDSTGQLLLKARIEVARVIHSSRYDPPQTACLRIKTAASWMKQAICSHCHPALPTYLRTMKTAR